MNSGDSGSFNRLSYDKCAYEKEIQQSTSPLNYRMYQGAFENDTKCVYNKDSFYHPYDIAIIDGDSELKGLGRQTSNCPQKKYNPNCDKSAECTSTFDESNPIVLMSEVCPIIKNNIQRVQGPGYTLSIDGRQNNNKQCK